MGRRGMAGKGHRECRSGSGIGLRGHRSPRGLDEVADDRVRVAGAKVTVSLLMGGMAALFGGIVTAVGLGRWPLRAERSRRT